MCDFSPTIPGDMEKRLLVGLSRAVVAAVDCDEDVTGKPLSVSMLM